MSRPVARCADCVTGELAVVVRGGGRWSGFPCLRKGRGGGDGPVSGAEIRVRVPSRAGRGRVRVGHDLVQSGQLGGLLLDGQPEQPTGEGKLYLCVIKDLLPNRIVGHAMGARMSAPLATRALAHAIGLRGPVGTILHSDRGGQFRSKRFTDPLPAHRLRGSMGRVGSFADNAAMESFFSLLEKNVLD